VAPQLPPLRLPATVLPLAWNTMQNDLVFQNGARSV